LEIADVSLLDMTDSLFFMRLDIYIKIVLILYADDILLKVLLTLDGIE